MKDRHLVVERGGGLNMIALESSWERRLWIGCRPLES